MKKDFKRNVLFFKALESKKIKKVKKFIDAGVDVNMQDTSGRKPLDLVVWGDKAENVKLVKMLIKAGAKVITQPKRETLLHSVAERGSPFAIARWLLYAGADLNAQDAEGRTPLHAAIKFQSNYYNRQDKPKTVKAFLEAGADVKARDFRGRTPFFMLAEITENFSKVAEMLLKAGADINARDKMDRTVLHEVVYSGNVTGVGALIEAGADINAQDRFGATPLHLAVGESGTFSHRTVAQVINSIEMLLDAGADITICDGYGNTAGGFVEKHWTIEYRKSYSNLFQKLGANPPEPTEEESS